MKKMIITPKKDSITICLPPDWVGKPLVCMLETPYEQNEEMVSQVNEDAVGYGAERFLGTRPGRPSHRKKYRPKR